MSDFGQVFPPRNEWDIAAYDIDEMVEGYGDGYQAQRADNIEPGANHSPAYRWGWCNAKRDHTHVDDGFDHVRSAFFRLKYQKNEGAAS